MGDKASECRLGSFHGADFVGDLHDSKIYIRWYVEKMWWKHKCADLMGMQKSGVSWQHWCGGGFLRHWSMAGRPTTHSNVMGCCSGRVGTPCCSSQRRSVVPSRNLARKAANIRSSRPRQVHELSWSSSRSLMTFHPHASPLRGCVHISFFL